MKITTQLLFLLALLGCAAFGIAQTTTSDETICLAKGHETGG